MGKVLQVRDVSDETYSALIRQAEARGQSLSQFLRDQLEDVARRNDSIEHNLRIFREAQAEPGPRVSREEILAALHEGRNER